MRKPILLVALLLAGCAAPSAVRRRPGADVALPVHQSFLSRLASGVACGAQRRDSVVPASVGPQTGKTTISAECQSILSAPRAERSGVAK
jgi:hypothetical protein